MLTQTYNDGSSDIINNIESDKTKLNLICDALKSLVEPQKINEMIQEMHKNGILKDKDVELLKIKGIFVDIQNEINIQHELQNSSNEQNIEENIIDNDDIEL